MGLENLSSIFNADIGDRIKDYQTTQPQHTNDSKVIDRGGAHLDSPILDIVMRKPNAFVPFDTPVYKVEKFDPRIPKNTGITITAKGKNDRYY